MRRLALIAAGAGVIGLGAWLWASQGAAVWLAQGIAFCLG